MDNTNIYGGFQVKTIRINNVAISNLTQLSLIQMLYQQLFVFH